MEVNRSKTMKTKNENAKFTTSANVLTAKQLKVFKRKYSVSKKVTGYLENVVRTFKYRDVKGAYVVLAIPTSKIDRVLHTIMISIGDTIAWIRVPNFQSYRELKKWGEITLLHGDNAILPLLCECTEESVAKLSAMDRKLLTIRRAA